MHDFFMKIVELVEYFGYFGIFVMTFVESTFIPIPSEITLVPAGYLIHQGTMNFAIVLVISVFGTVTGSLANYWIAYYFGESLLVNYGKYFFLKKGTLESMKAFFNKHGEISMFSGRLLPGTKHFISFPAGLSKMRLTPFIIYTSLGAIVWVSILLAIGYYVGKNDALVKHYIKNSTYILVAVVAVVALCYWKYNKYKKRKLLESSKQK